MRTIFLVALAAVTLAGCGGSDDVAAVEPVVDSGTDAGHPDGTGAPDAQESGIDAHQEAATEAAVDAGTDAPNEASGDASPDTSEDVAEDVAPDVVQDVLQEAGQDAAQDVAPDVLPDVAQDAVPDVAPDVLPDVAQDAPAEAEAGVPQSLRLLVAGTGSSGGGVFIWDLPDSIMAPVAPTTVLNHASVNAGTSCLAVLGTRLYAGLPAPSTPSAPILTVFDNAATVAGSTAPAAQIPRSALVGTNPAVEQLLVHAGSDTLWTGSFMAGIQLFTGAAALSSSSVSKARFDHAWQQTPGFAYDGTSDRLFAGQISGAGLLAWNGAKALTGTPTHDFASPNNAIWTAAVDGSRLYAGGSVNTSSAVAIWTNLPSFTAATAPAVVMGSASGISGFVPHVAVQQGFLVVTLQANKVLLFANAASLSGDLAPTATVVTTGSPKKSVLSKSGRLYVLDATGVEIFDHATTTPVSVAKLTTPIATGADVALIE